VLLAGPISFLAALCIMAGGSRWIPAGAANIDHLVVPVVLFPALWASLFFYTSLSRRLMRAYALVLSLTALSVAMVLAGFWGRP
jgi:hypothetical protein